jgi:hypothetical protein
MAEITTGSMVATTTIAQSDLPNNENNLVAMRVLPVKISEPVRRNHRSSVESNTLRRRHAPNALLHIGLCLNVFQV